VVSISTKALRRGHISGNVLGTKPRQRWSAHQRSSSPVRHPTLHEETKSSSTILGLHDSVACRLQGAPAHLWDKVLIVDNQYRGCTVLVDRGLAHVGSPVWREDTLIRANLPLDRNCDRGKPPYQASAGAPPGPERLSVRK
jgi:hypothetical protein